MKHIEVSELNRVSLAVAPEMNSFKGVEMVFLFQFFKLSDLVTSLFLSRWDDKSCPILIQLPIGL